MPPKPTISSFLAAARSALAAPAAIRPSPLTIVVGNESAGMYLFWLDKSCVDLPDNETLQWMGRQRQIVKDFAADHHDSQPTDLDSLCSALLYAYLRTHSIPQGSLHVPLCNLLREDLSLRPEFIAVLKKAGTSPDEVITLSELPSTAELKPEDTQWILVDHNALTGGLAKLYSKQVVGCIDHHADEDVIAKDVEPRVIEKTGSCMTLVVRECKAAWEALASSSSSDVELEDQLAHLALAPVLVDTHGLKDVNKTTQEDKDVVSYLESKVRNTGAGYSNEKYYASLDDLKKDLSSLSVRDILRKDYKEWDEAGLKLGTSSVSQEIEFLLKTKTDGSVDEFVKAMGAWGEEKSIDLNTVLTTCNKNGVFCRGLMLWARGSAAVEAAKRFEAEFGERLGLQTWGDKELDVDAQGDWRRCWDQSGVEYSRKQIAPMLREAMKGN